jgi:DNA-binding transcriptional ArsR family regulator
VPPTSSTLDPFSAIAEPRRREVLATLAHGELPVNDIVAALGWPQPQVSKHLAVLREVGIVAVRRRGRERLYSINGEGLKTIHDWTAMFGRFWTHHIDRVKLRAEALARAAEAESAAAAPIAPHPLLAIRHPSKES